tara:strand:- start:75 stop:404 length:330 start_codon:yes stop_codon:yes gene_type:complete
MAPRRRSSNGRYLPNAQPETNGQSTYGVMLTKPPADRSWVEWIESWTPPFEAVCSVCLMIVAWKLVTWFQIEDALPPPPPPPPPAAKGLAWMLLSELGRLGNLASVVAK